MQSKWEIFVSEAKRLKMRMRMTIHYELCVYLVLWKKRQIRADGQIK